MAHLQHLCNRPSRIILVRPQRIDQLAYIPVAIGFQVVEFEIEIGGLLPWRLVARDSFDDGVFGAVEEIDAGVQSAWELERVVLAW